ncbi:TetR/AcrR family transcriptional regulator [Litoreibacter albidus]|uniref:TetR/AcrR family transcriptional regulator n=1 Tax=Litoreibacter albidus TaxID=670155 RepID=UPI003734F1A8
MQDKNQTRTNRARTEATQLALLEAARGFFSTKGYAETSTPEVVRAAGITRGALYHHYEGKAALFRAVVTAEFTAVAAHIEAVSQKGEGQGLEALQLGARGYLDAMQVEGRVRIMLLDGPAVLGRAALERIDRDTSGDTLRVGLQVAIEQQHIKTLPLDALTAQLSALFDRAALSIFEGARAEDHLAVIDALILSLRT